MAKKNDEYRALSAELAAGDIGACYIFYGPERYLLERSVADIRKRLIPEGEGGFNHRRYGAAPPLDELREAVETFPFFAERTLIEVSDYDFTSGLDALLPILRELPEHACVLFICGEEWKLDRRLSATKELLKLVRAVEFDLQGRERLVPWISRHFRESGITVSASDAEYLAFITGGLMSSLRLEIEKLAAHCAAHGQSALTRAQIDELVAAVPDAVSYKLTDAVAMRDYRAAARVLDELIAMREPAHRLIYALTSKMRALLLARHYTESGQGVKKLMETAGIRYEFQAKSLMAAARSTTVPECEEALRLCANTAFRLNDGGGTESVTELVARLAARRAS